MNVRLSEILSVLVSKPAWATGKGIQWLIWHAGEIPKRQWINFNLFHNHHCSG
jgi:hypothetical protein